MYAGKAMEARAAQGDDIHKKAAHITKLLHRRPGDAAAATAAVDEFVAACSALPPGQTAAGLESALGRSTCRRLEEAALRSFRQQLRGRPLPDGTMPRVVPRALAELRSAAKAWGLSPLVLLAEFAHAPKSDHFWRLLARLARSRRHGSWPDVRERLHAARHRRRHDLLARRQGVSHVQPWAIPDITAVLKQQEEESEEEQEEEEEREDEQEIEQAHEQVHQRQEQACLAGTRQDDAAAGHTNHRPAVQNGALDSTNATLPVPQRPNSDGESAEIGENDGSEAGNDALTDTVYVSGSEQTSVWHFAYGWWLPANIVHRLCSSLVRIQPKLFQFTASRDVISSPADVTKNILSPRLGQPDDATSTIIAPLRMKTSSHWILATLCPSEKVVSVYDPQPGSRLSHTEVAAALGGLLANEQLPRGNKAVAVADCAVVTRSCPAQANSIDSGVAVIALSLYCLVGRAIPTSLDNWLWRRMLSFYLTRLSPGDAAQTTKDIALVTLFAKTLSVRNIHTPADTTTATTAAFAAELPPPQNDGDQSHMETEKNVVDGIQQQSFVEHNIPAQRDSVIEGRAIWTAAAKLASRAETDARIKRDAIGNELQHAVDALLHLEAEMVSRRHTRRRDARTALEGDGAALAMSVRRLETAVKTAEADVAGIAVVVNGIRAVLEDLGTLLPSPATTSRS